MGSLPEELVIEIMSWLPPESLVQSKCVNKYWYNLITSLINDPSFVSKHLRNLNDNKTTNIFASHSVAMTCLRAFQTPVKHYRELISLLTLSNSGEKISTVTELLNLPIIPDGKDMSSVTATHCNGLICLADYYHNVVLLNPALNKYRDVPKPTLVDRFNLQGVGFGFDSRAEDYKVVRFGRDLAAQRTRAEIYSLRSNSWREIRMGLGPGFFPSLNVELYLNGRFYWLMSGSGCHAVSWVDLSDEEFRSVALPAQAQVASAKWASLAAWKESVALLLCVDGGGGDNGPASVEVWALDGPDWEKKFTVGPVHGLDCPLAFWNDGQELLVRGSSLKEVLSYNVRTRQFRTVCVDGLDGIGCRAFSYVKSLVSV